MKIVIDAMGGDNAPSQIIKGVIDGLPSCNAQIVLVGRQADIEAELAKYENVDKNRISIVNASEVIDNNESPVFALRRKKDSSIVRALEIVKNDYDTALISAGSTGALFAGGLLLCGRLEGIERPALATALPAKNGASLLLDSGANVDCDVKNLVEFAVLGSAYMQTVFGMENPRVGLINNGAEEKKGCNLTKEAFQALKQQSGINFCSNVEPRDIYDNVADVLVCDGFVGNTILKTSEGMGGYILGSLKTELRSSKKATFGALFVRKSLNKLKDRFNYEKHGGAPLLGVDANIIKIHGSSKSSTVQFAMIQAEKMISGNVVSAIKNNVQKILSVQNKSE